MLLDQNSKFQKNDHPTFTPSGILQLLFVYIQQNPGNCFLLYWKLEQKLDTLWTITLLPSLIYVGHCSRENFGAIGC